MDTPTDAVLVAARTSGTDMAPTIQAALDKSRKIRLDGTYDLKAPLLMSDGQQVWGTPRTNVFKAYDSSGATSRSFVCNRNFNARVRDLVFAGGFNVAARPGMGGNIFGLLANNVVMDGVRMTYWTGGRAVMMGGDGIKIRNGTWRCDPAGDSGVGGIRFAGGRDLLVENMDIVSGDDVYQFVPAGVATDPLFNCGDTINGWYRNCKGRSLSARLCIAALQDENNDGSTKVGMNIGIANSGFEAITGFGGGSAIVVKNASSTKGITGLAFRSVSVDQRDAEAGQPAEVYLLNYAGLGAINGVDFSGVTVANRRKTLYRADGPNISNIKQPRAS